METPNQDPFDNPERDKLKGAKVTQEIRLICDDCCIGNVCETPGQTQEEFADAMIQHCGWKNIAPGDDDNLNYDKNLYFCPDCNYDITQDYHEVNFEMYSPEEIEAYEAMIMLGLQGLKEAANDNNEYGLDYGGF